MKSVNYYRTDNELAEGVSCILFTKNNESDIEDLFATIKKSKINEVLVSDEFSTDETVNKLKKYTNKIFFSKKNFLDRQKELLNHVKYKYLIIVEADQRLSDNYSELMLEELKDRKCHILQSLLRIKSPKNYFEAGMSIVYELLKKPGHSSFFTGPCITYSKLIIELMQSIKIYSNSSIDTLFNEHLKQNNCSIYTSKILAYQYENLTYDEIKSKFAWYGRGDYYFFISNYRKWGFFRKLRSLSHVSIRYFIRLPLYSIYKLRPHLIFFYFLCGFIRYKSFIDEFLKKN